MLLYNRELSLVISNLQGLYGQKELKAFLKKAHIPREYLKHEGHPHEECIMVPLSKQDSMISRGCVLVNIEEFKEYKNNKVSPYAAHELTITVASNAYNYTFSTTNNDKKRQKDRKNSQKSKDSFLNSGFDPNLV